MNRKIPLFLGKIEERKADVCVVGLGQVGMPTALIFADSGFNVTGYDINEKIVNQMNRGVCHFSEPGINELLKECLEKKRFRASIDFKKTLASSDVVIICVPTPLSAENKPNLDFLADACRTLAKNPLKDKLIVIESSIPPGTTRNLVIPILRKNKYKLDKDFWVVYIPERLAPGKALEEISKNSRIIGSYDAVGAEIARALYKNIIKSDLLITQVDVAETSKLVENTYRDVNIAFSNETAKICEQLGIDVMEVVRVANTHPRVHVHVPGVGVGGPCIPKDPYLLISPYLKLNLDLDVIPRARAVNEAMPLHLVSLTEKALKEGGISFSDATVLCLGVAYKGNVSDTRNTPAEDVVRALLDAGSKVSAYDPFTDETFGAKKCRNLDEGVKSADAVVILTDHDEFRLLDLAKLKKLMKRNAVLVDGRRIYSPAKVKSAGIRYVAVGLGR